MRPSVVGKWTSSIWMPASLSSTALRVRPGGQRLELCAHRDVQAMRFDAVLKTVVDRTLQIVLEIFKRSLNLDELNIELPQLCRILVAQIAAQQVSNFAATRFS